MTWPDLSGKVIVTCSLPMDEDSTRLVVAHTSSGAERLAKKVPKAKVVSAFGTVPSEVFFDVYEARRDAKRPSLVYCGDDAGSKKVVAGLIRDVGFDPVDAGPLRIARYTKPFTMLIAQLAYEGSEGPEWPTGSSGLERKAVMPEFEVWESFYAIVGAAGALIGLQFVVMTLIAERPPLRGRRKPVPRLRRRRLYILVSRCCCRR
jgi:hypothetical protein